MENKVKNVEETVVNNAVRNAFQVQHLQNSPDMRDAFGISHERADELDENAKKAFHTIDLRQELGGHASMSSLFQEATSICRNVNEAAFLVDKLSRTMLKAKIAKKAGPIGMMVLAKLDAEDAGE